MNRLRKTLALLAVIGIPAAAQSTFAPGHDDLCFASGAATYQIARNAPLPDIRVRVAADVPNADLRMQLVDRAEIADFVLVDDFSGREPARCRSTTPIKTVAVDAETASPDVVVKLSAEAGPSDYKLYVHSVRYSQQDAAALLAAMWKANQRREAALVSELDIEHSR